MHHGNGTADIVKALRRPEALFFCSTHLYDGEFYPASGDGKGGALAANVLDLPIPPLWKKSGVRSLDDQASRDEDHSRPSIVVPHAAALLHNIHHTPRTSNGPHTTLHPPLHLTSALAPT